jgi:hypothetical protein
MDVPQILQEEPMRRPRIRTAIRRWSTRRRFARVLRAYGYPVTKQLVDMALDFEGDADPQVLIREGWRP